MVKLIFYIGILIILCYILDYLWLKSLQSFRELKKAYKDFKDAEENLKKFLE
jgi:hypothetical protein